MLLETYDKYYETNRYTELVQFVKYGVSGLFSTVVQMVLFFLIGWKIFPALQESDLMVKIFGLTLTKVDLAARTFNAMLSNGISFMFSNLVAYILNIYWVFKPEKHIGFKEIVLFYLVSGLSVFFGSGIIGLLIRYFNVEMTFAFSVNVMASLSINYIIRKHIIFKS